MPSNPPGPLSATDVVQAYGAAWLQREAHARRRLLERAWGDDASYCDPTARLEGREALLAHIAASHDRLPGRRLEITSSADKHHGCLRFAWRMLGPDGAMVLEGMDFGERDSDGRLRRVVGFFGPTSPPAAPA